MLFIKKHIIYSEKSLDIVKTNLLSKNTKLEVLEKSKNELFGIMKNKYGSGFDIISEIKLKNNTEIFIQNKFDLFTNFFLIALYLALWSFCFYNLNNGSKIFSFEIIVQFIFPIIATFIVKISFDIYDKKIMEIYSSLLKNDNGKANVTE